MDVTLYRYRFSTPTWSSQSIQKAFLETLVSEMMGLPFHGEEAERQFGFAHCGFENDIVYGLFVQKFPKTLTDYDTETKQEIKQESIDTGEYLFIMRLKEYEIYLQAKRVAELPERAEIINRFTELLKIALSKTPFIFHNLKETEEEIDREKIINIFYKDADDVSEMEFNKFDPNLISEEKAKRGGTRQVYFNPKEEYQEGLEESAIRFATNAEKASVKAKKGGDIKKDPITRALLEGSRNPTKIVYRKEQIEYTDSAVTKNKQVISVEGPDFKLDNPSQLENIFSQLFSQVKPSKNDMQKSEFQLFDNE